MENYYLDILSKIPEKTLENNQTVIRSMINPEELDPEVHLTKD